MGLQTSTAGNRSSLASDCTEALVSAAVAKKGSVKTKGMVKCFARLSSLLKLVLVKIDYLD